jgi:hypothetical protein
LVDVVVDNVVATYPPGALTSRARARSGVAATVAFCVRRSAERFWRNADLVRRAHRGCDISMARTRRSAINGSRCRTIEDDALAHDWR